MLFVAVIRFFLKLLLSTANNDNFINYTRMKHSESTFKMIRRCERDTKRLQKTKAHIEFIRCCLIYNLTPTFLQFHRWKQQKSSSKQLETFHRHCLQNEYRLHQKNARRLEIDLQLNISHLENILSSTDYIRLQSFLRNIATLERDRVVKIHQRKLNSLNKGPVGQHFMNMNSRIVHNLSSHILSESEERLLCRGWEFCVEQRITNFLEFKTDIEMNAKKIEQNCHSTIFRSISRHLHDASQQLMRTARNKLIRNLSDDELSALHTLKSNQEIIICKSDKGNAIVIMDRDDYIERAQTILSGSQFEKSSNMNLLHEKQEHMNKYIRSLYDKNIIDKKLFYQIRSTSSNISVFYGLPKIHKLTYPLRPIISSVGSYQYNLSKYLARLISDCISPPPSYVKDSFNFSNMIKSFTLEPTKSYTMCSFDVESLFTNVPVREAIDIAVDLLFEPTKRIDTPLDKDQIKTLLEYAVCDAPFRFLNDIYIQKDGVAMGSPLAPILANLFMIRMEEKLNKISSKKPTIWLRYVDDVFCLFTHSRNEIIDFLSQINKLHTNLKFVVEWETNDSLPFLDVLVIRKDHQLLTTLYRKPTHTNLYLLYDSNQNRQYKLCLIRTLVIRILRICSTPEFVNVELNLLRKTLRHNGYPSHIVRKGINEGQIIFKRLQRSQSKIGPQRKSILFTIAYYGQESTLFALRIKKVCKKYLPHIDIRFAFRKQHTLKSIFLPLVKGKDINRCKHKLVYLIPCSNCNKVYIGETARTRDIRITEHQANIRNNESSSALAKHVETEKHLFDFDNVRTLSRETEWSRRIIKESILTHESFGKAINDTKFTLKVFG